MINCNDDLTVRQHLEYVARLHHTEDWEAHAEWRIDSVGLAARADDLPATFSRGLKQKAAIAMAFVRPFELMLIDEPFVGLDRAGRSALLDLISWAHDDGATILVATHELASVTSRSKGRAKRSGPGSALASSSSSRACRVTGVSSWAITTSPPRERAAATGRIRPRK